MCVQKLIAMLTNNQYISTAPQNKKSTLITRLHNAYIPSHEYRVLCRLTDRSTTQDLKAHFIWEVSCKVKKKAVLPLTTSVINRKSKHLLSVTLLSTHWTVRS